MKNSSSKSSKEDSIVKLIYEEKTKEKRKKHIRDYRKKITP
jgi:hypothetical protein